jgi:thiosulfate/3-mercaptopyruvate sulfurtransferase
MGGGVTARVHGTLVDVATLAARLDDPRWVVIDCRSTLGDPRAGPRRYAEGHIPGARYAHLEHDLSDQVTAQTGRHPLPDPVVLARRLGEWGVGDEIQVLAYDDAGGPYAARLWWLLRWLGHEAVAVLDGGLQAWTAAGHRLETAERKPESRHFDAWLDDTRWLDTHEVLELVTRQADGLLIDARGPARYSGAEEPIDPVAGHIPGAINAPFTGNLAPDGRFLPRAALRERFESALDGRSPRDAVHYCGSGVTACHNVLAMEHAGMAGSRLYAGSWSEWIRDSQRPVARNAE